MIPESFIERLKDTSDIEETISSYVPLKRLGRLLKGLCPFHSEKTPSFTVYTDGPQHFYCFGCHKGGDVITFIREIENLEYVEAVRLLAQRAGLKPQDSAEFWAGVCSRQLGRSHGASGLQRLYSGGNAGGCRGLSGAAGPL